jgi:hypothetical protein
LSLRWFCATQREAVSASAKLILATCTIMDFKPNTPSPKFRRY